MHIAESSHSNVYGISASVANWWLNSEVLHTRLGPQTCVYCVPEQVHSRFDARLHLAPEMQTLRTRCNMAAVCLKACSALAATFLSWLCSSLQRSELVALHQRHTARCIVHKLLSTNRCRTHTVHQT